MMHVSPCGWFCFRVPHEWEATDHPKSTVVFSKKGRGRIEITSARKNDEVQFDEITEMHESIIHEFPAQIRETATNKTDTDITYISSTVSDHEYVTVITHLFWGNYCIYIRLDSPIDEHLLPEMEALDFIVYSIESLTID